jgi:hypothetical protein
LENNSTLLLQCSFSAQRHEAQAAALCPSARDPKRHRQRSERLRRTPRAELYFRDIVCFPPRTRRRQHRPPKRRGTRQHQGEVSCDRKGTTVTRPPRPGRPGRTPKRAAAGHGCKWLQRRGCPRTRALTGLRLAPLAPRVTLPVLRARVQLSRRAGWRDLTTKRTRLVPTPVLTGHAASTLQVKVNACPSRRSGATASSAGTPNPNPSPTGRACLRAPLEDRSLRAA